MLIEPNMSSMLEYALLVQHDSLTARPHSDQKQDQLSTPLH
jgi:hypothetical protein